MGVVNITAAAFAGVRLVELPAFQFQDSERVQSDCYGGVRRVDIAFAGEWLNVHTDSRPSLVFRRFAQCLLVGATAGGNQRQTG